MNGSLMLKIEMHTQSTGFKIMFCKAISSDPMNDQKMIMQFLNGEVMEIKISEIKHISSYEK